MKPPTDTRLEISIARMLRIGVGISATIVSVGGLLYLRAASREMSDYSRFSAAQASLRTITGILHGASHVEAESVIELGILVLIATPIMRVALRIVGFARQRDRLYIAVSTSVFIIPIYSFFRGGR
jgi:uncharacterized membrane protein